MKQVFVEERGKIAIRNVPIPKLEPGTILVKIEVATICGQTDLHIIEGLHPGATPFPCVLGHEGAGVVADVGPGVKDFVPGDRVALRAWSDGTFSEYVKVRVDDALKIPDNMSFEEGSMLEITSCVFGLVDQCVRLGDSVVILGQGVSGLLATQISRAAGAGRIIVTSRNKMKRDLGLQFGADIAIDPREKDVIEEVGKITGSCGVDVVLECAGVPSTIAACPQLVKQQGTIGIFGACVQPVSFDFFAFHQKWARILSTGFKWAYSKGTFVRALELYTSGKISLKPLITHWYSLDQIEDAFDLLRKGDERVVKIAIKP
ncbi:MAG TPA: zinc-binding dehydrogenase [Firmicutes bacterium]|nr:zinc-binding dehydrogenase [Bacillota bacterium]